MGDISLTSREAYLYGALFTASIGFVIGLIPLVVGIVKKKVKLGVLGLLASTVGGGILGLILALPFAAIFTWLILKQEPSTATSPGSGDAV
jgi:hypothetical protein